MATAKPIPRQNLHQNSPRAREAGERLADLIRLNISQAAFTRRKPFHMAVAAPDISTLR